MDYTISIPQEIQQVLSKLQEKGFQAYIVGGCVRDIIMSKEPKDWDVTTNALPNEIQAVFQKSLYLNDFGTVTVKVKDVEVEVTTYRSDGKYSDGRHPDEVQFGVSLEEDLARRDFTVNALAYDGKEIIDKYEGLQDIENKIIKAVGNPAERFQEDALRMLRAIRFSSQLGFSIEEPTWQAICENKDLLKKVSAERIRDELVKMIQSDESFKAIWLLQTSGLLKLVLPELDACVGVAQNLHHIYSVFTHLAFSMQYCPSNDWRVRLASLLHDVAKPDVKEGEGKQATFYNHEYASAKMARKIMKRLACSKEDTKKVTHLIRNHMFYYNMGEITDAGVRRLLKRIGKEHMDDLMAVRIADRMGSGVQKDKPYKLIELEKRIAYVQKDPISTSMLAINGDILITEFNMSRGARIGVLLHRLLDEVIEDPKKNTKDYLKQRTTELLPDIQKMSEEEARGIMKTYRDTLADINSFKG